MYYEGVVSRPVLCPDDQIALKLIECAGPIAAPSANISTRPSIVDSETAISELDKGKNVRLIVPSTISSTDIADIKQLKKHGVKVKYMPAEKLYMHAKMIAGRKAFIGSENFTRTSLNRNRETGIILSGFFVVSKLKNTFSSDWRRARRSLKLAKSWTATKSRKYGAKRTAK